MVDRKQEEIKSFWQDFVTSDIVDNVKNGSVKLGYSTFDDVAELEIYHCAIDKYGITHQLNILKEELAECVVATSHYQRDRDDDVFENLVEEIADVEIMLSQAKIMLKQKEGTEYFNMKYEKFKNEKLARLQGRVNNEKPDSAV